MPEQYFNIPLGRLPSLVEMQNLLRRRLPAGAVFTDPDTFHMTLVYIEDNKGADLSFDEVANDLPIFGIGASYITNFNTDGGTAIVACVDSSPQLIYLQSAIYYRAQASGARVSGYSYPNRWRAHITLAMLPAPSMDEISPEYGYRPTDIFMSAPVHMEVRRFVLTEEGNFDPVKEWTLRGDIPVQEFLERLQPNFTKANEMLKLREQAEDINGRTRISLTCVSEIKGGYPNIPLPDDIDVAAIKAQGREFTTLPIGEVDARSRNDRNYRRQAMESLVKQINTNRSEGGWGHIKDEDLATEYEPPAVRWLAAMIDKKGVVWGKCLPLTKEAQQYFEDARLTNARVGTSLHAWALMDGDDVLDLELIKLDLADPARVGVPIAAAKPQLSAEMHSDEGGASVLTQKQDGQTPEAVPSTEQSQQEVNRQPVEKENTVTERVTELELERKDLKSQIAILETDNKRLKDVEDDAKEVREFFGIAEGLDFVKAARQFKSNYDDMVAENSSLLMDSAKAIVAEKVKVESVRPLVMELVSAEKPVTRKALARAIDDVLNRDSVKELLRAKLVEEMGPNQTPPPGEQKPAPAASYLAPKPEVVS